MIGRKELFRVCERALARSTARETEIVVLADESSLTRFANNTIHQNLLVNRVECIVRAVVGKSVGVGTVVAFDEDALSSAVEDACETARLQPPDEDFPGLPGPEPFVELDAFDERTAQFTPEARGEAVRTIVQLARSEGAVASGFFSTDWLEIAVVNSRGVRAWFPTTKAELSTVITKETGSGYEQFRSVRASAVDVEGLARRALDKAIRSQNPEPIEPGEYVVVLEPQATAGLLELLAFIGFGAKEYLEGESFLTGKMGQRILGENVTLRDDGLSVEGLPLPFDFEGVPRKPVTIIERGVAKGVVYDRRRAAKAGTSSTGHALPSGTEAGPLPLHLHMEPGESSLEAMIASTAKGLLVSRFHYMNVVEPKQAILTGMTRDGTFRIERGEVAGPVRDLRFTESMLKALNRVAALSRDRRLCGEYVVAPAVKIEGFRFTGKK